MLEMLDVVVWNNTSGKKFDANLLQKSRDDKHTSVADLMRTMGNAWLQVLCVCCLGLGYERLVSRK